MKRFTLRLQDDFHYEIKLKCVKENITMNEYITTLIQLDLKIKEVTND